MSSPYFQANLQINAGCLDFYAYPVPPSTPVPVLRLIQCAERELKRRRRWYANRIVAGRMTVVEAASEIWEMQGIVSALRDGADLSGAAPSARHGGEDANG